MDKLLPKGPKHQRLMNDNKPDGMDDQIYRPPHYEFNQWRKEQIFTDMATANGIGSGGVVPNVNDVVVSFVGTRKTEELVTFVDPITYKSTLEIITYPKGGADAVVGVDIGVGNLANVAILYFNPNDPKLGVVVDHRLPITGIYGSTLSYARIFLGTDVGGTGHVISVRYDALGNIINDRIPVEQVDSEPNVSKRYIVRPGSIDTLVPHDTVVTLCIYNDTNSMVWYQTLVVKYNGLVSNFQDRTLFVSNVVLETPYLNPTNSREILIPKNLLHNSFMPRVFKEFTNGRRQEMFIGTSNVSLYGWGDYINDDVNESFDIMLNYVLDRHERSEDVSQFTGNHISYKYKVRIIDSDTAIDAKLFVLPTYDISTSSYKLEFYLYTGLRTSSINVTKLVSVEGFDGKQFGAKQRIDFSIDLATVDNMPKLVFADTIDLMLMNVPMATDTMYRLWYYRDPARWFGERLRVQMKNHFGTRTIDVSNQVTQKSEWLERMYHASCPIYDRTLSDDAPNPTYVDVTIGGVTNTIDIDTFWNGETPWNKEQVVANGANAILKWYSRNDGGERLELAITNLPVEYI